MHHVSKYGGKGVRELFTAMPPFEMVKLLFVRALSKASLVSRSLALSSRARDTRKIMFIDVSKSHLYALTNADVIHSLIFHPSAVEMVFAASPTVAGSGGRRVQPATGRGRSGAGSRLPLILSRAQVLGAKSSGEAGTAAGSLPSPLPSRQPVRLWGI